MKQPNFNYYTLRPQQVLNRFEFTTLSDLYEFACKNQVTNIFLLYDGNGTVNKFGILHNNALFEHDTTGFKTLEDYYKAREQHFPDAVIFYKALTAGYSKYEDYRLVEEAGIADKEIFNQVKQLGFIEGFSDYCDLIKSNEIPAEPESFKNPFELYNYAMKHGFKDYQNLKKAVTKGFVDESTFTIAKEKGFELFADYKEALEKDFRSLQELELARTNNVRNRNDFMRFIDLENVNCGGCSHDKKVLLALISKLEQGKKISINKLYDLFEQAVNAYRYSDDMTMPLWFTQQLNDKELFTAFLNKSEEIKKFGVYDNDGEFFQVNFLQERKIVIDGSNVAHNSNGNGGSRPYVKNIVSMIEHLRSKGFTEIVVINDASLKRKLADPEKLEALKEIADCLEAPKENPADIFIIQYVKRYNCLLVSNDTFREWKIQDPWVAENIDFYRLAFMINNEDILMPDLK